MPMYISSFFKIIYHPELGKGQLFYYTIRAYSIHNAEFKAVPLDKHSVHSAQIPVLV
jgi:hypothetical protein